MPLRWPLVGRAARGLTSEDIAEKLGVRGRVELADALGVDGEGGT